MPRCLLKHLSVSYMHTNMQYWDLILFATGLLKIQCLLHHCRSCLIKGSSLVWLRNPQTNKYVWKPFSLLTNNNNNTKGLWIERRYLTAHNWQKWKRVFLTCLCHKIDRDEAVGLKSYKYTWKMEMWNLGNIVKIWYFINNC